MTQTGVWSRGRWVTPRLLAVAVASVVGGLGVGLSAASASAPCGSGVYSQSGTTQTCTYTSPGEDTFGVPAGVTSLSVTAVGASGGVGSLLGSVGGAGAVVVDTGLPVPTGASTLWVDVGQPGAGGGGFCSDTDQVFQAAGGLFDGGPSGTVSCGFLGGGGGGSSAVLTEPHATAMSDAQLTGNPATDARLLVAGGGGGGAAGITGPAFYAGGSAGDGMVTGAGAGGCSAPGGAGGVGPIDGSNGGGAGGCDLAASGTATSGGAGYTDTDGYGGGGGGGGWFGGGGADDLGTGGAGSSYGGAGPSAGITIATASASQTPEVQISWTEGPPSVTITTPPNNAVYTYGQLVDANYACTAGTNATLESCLGTAADGNPIKTTTVGSDQHFTVTATDTDNQTTSVTNTYTVTAAPTSLTASPQVDLVAPHTAVGLDIASATLTSGGTPLSGQTITFTDGSLYLCTAVTNSAGIAKCSIPPKDEVWVLLNNHYTATFTATTDYTGTIATTPAVVL